MSCVITGNLVTEIRGTDDFQLGDYALLMGEGRYEIQQLHGEAAETALGEAWDATYMEDACWMGRITRTGAWMSVLPYTVNGTELGAQEWMDSLFLCYGIKPPTYRNIKMGVVWH